MLCVDFGKRLNMVAASGAAADDNSYLYHSAATTCGNIP
jgi:hypothetical protein